MADAPDVHPGCTSCDPRAACPYHEGYADGRDEERAAVVEALRKWPPIGPSIALIERGDHHV